MSSSSQVSTTVSSSSGTVPSSALLTTAELAAVNVTLASATPQEILTWAIDNLPGLYQTTAFGLTGLAALDMVAKISSARKSATHLVPLIFIDTLYHFKETLELSTRASDKYGVKLDVYTPPRAATTAEFESVYGTELWKSDEETYDYLVKVSRPFTSSYQG